MDKQVKSVYCISCLALIGVILIILGGTVLVGAPIQAMVLTAWLFLFPVCSYIGFSFDEVMQGSLEYMNRGMGAVLIVVGIGALIGSWIAAGTVPTFIVYGLKMINPKVFLPAAFLLSCCVAYFCGTAWGAMGTIGLGLYAVGVSLGVSKSLVVGTIVSGAQLGDMASPMSTSTTVAAAAASADHTQHIKKIFLPMLTTAAGSSAIYWLIGWRYKDRQIDPSIVANLENTLSVEFKMDILAMLPLFVLIFLLIIKKPAFLSMMASVGVAMLIAILYQGISVQEIILIVWDGYVCESGHALADSLLSRGGIQSMSSTILMMIFAFGVVGAFHTANILETIVAPITREVSNVYRLTFITQFICILTSIIGTSSFSLLIVGSLMGPVYDQMKIDRTELAKISGATSCPIAALSPWNVSGLYIAEIFGIGVFQYGKLAIGCYLMPILTGLSYTVLKNKVSWSERKKASALD